MILRRMAALALALMLALGSAPTWAEEAAEAGEAPESPEATVELAEGDEPGPAADAEVAIEMEAIDALETVELLEAVALEEAVLEEMPTLAQTDAAQVEDNANLLPINDSVFPDSAFRKYISAKIDVTRDNFLSTNEIANTAVMDISGKGIADLKGIDRFTGLQRLKCRKNKLTTLNLPALKKLEYLDCRDNRLTKLDVSKCASLVELYCSNNRLASLNLTKNKALVRLDCRSNKLKSIDVNRGGALAVMYCQDNAMKTVDIAQLPKALRSLVTGAEKGMWNDGALFWVKGDARLYLPGLVTVKNGEKTLYTKKDIYSVLFISGKRSNYERLNDKDYANFRNVTTTGMGRHALYRSSSPLSGKFNRNKQAMAAMKSAKVRTVINMYQEPYTARSQSGFSRSYYAKTNLWARRLQMKKVNTLAFRNSMTDICRFMIAHKGPYMVHCLIGRDRTGILCALLECLMGASRSEIIQDYMKSYDNFFNIQSGSWEYDYLVKTRIVSQLDGLFGVNITGKKVNLARCAEKYLLKCGLTQEEIASLKKRLATNY